MLGRLAVRATDPEGSPVDARVLAYDPEGGLVYASGRSAAEHLVDVARGVPVDLLATADGFRPRLLRGRVTDTAVVLEPGIPVTLEARAPVVLERDGRGAFLLLRPDSEPEPACPPGTATYRCRWRSGAAVRSSCS